MLSRLGERTLIGSFLLAGALSVHAAPEPQARGARRGRSLSPVSRRNSRHVLQNSTQADFASAEYGIHSRFVCRTRNILKTSNPNLQFRMESKPEGFYETAVSTLPQASPSMRSELTLSSAPAE